jgi:hypothetical protein
MGSYTHLDALHRTAGVAPGAEQAAEAPTGRVWRGWLWVLIVAVTIAALVANRAHAEDESVAVLNVSPIGLPAPDRRGTEQRPLVIDKTVDAVKRETADQAEHAYNERVTTWSTVILAGVTFALFAANIWLIGDSRRVSNRQAKDTRDAIAEQTRSADAMRDVAEATKNNATLMSGMLSKQMRAYIAVELGTAVYQDKRLVFEAIPTITNNGLTPARNVCFGIFADILDGSKGDPAIPDLGELIVNDMGLMPRQQLTIRAIVPRRIPDEEVADVMKGYTRRLFTWGLVTYDDVFGGHWETRFCMSYAFPLVENELKVSGAYTHSHNIAT